MGVGVQRHASAGLPPGERDPVPIIKDSGCALGRDGKGPKIPAPTGIRSLDRPFHNAVDTPAARYSTVP